MSMLINLQNDINNIVNKYEMSQESLTKMDALTITKIREFVNTAELASTLIRQLSLYTDKMVGKFWSFLPFVNDLKRELIKLIKKPEYQLGIILIEENAEIFRENRKLREEINDLKGNNTAIKELKEKVSALESELELQRQTMRLLMEERDALLKKNADLKLENNMLQVRAELAETKVQGLEEKLFNLVDENAKLMQELAEQKQQLRIIQNNSLANGKQDEYININEAEPKKLSNSIFNRFRL